MSALKSLKFGAALCESDTYSEQFCTEKFKFTALVSFTVLHVCSYRISVENAKDENLILYIFFNCLNVWQSMSASSKQSNKGLVTKQKDREF